MLPAIHLLQRFLTCICLLSSWKHFEILPRHVLSGGRMLLGSLQSPSHACSPPCTNNNLSGRCLPGPRYHAGDAGRRGPKDLTFSVDGSSSGRKCNGRLGDDLSSSTATHLSTASQRWQFPTALPPDELLCWAFSEQFHKEIFCLFCCGMLPSSKWSQRCLIEHCEAEQHSQHGLILLLIQALAFWGSIFSLP